MERNERKHTPGPWMLGVEGDGAVGSVYCDNAFGSRVAIVYGKGQEFSVFSPDEERANAALIAAAPTLLEALKQIADDNHAGARPREIARAAIALATSANLKEPQQ